MAGFPAAPNLAAAAFSIDLPEADGKPRRLPADFVAQLRELIEASEATHRKRLDERDATDLGKLTASDEDRETEAAGCLNGILYRSRVPPSLTFPKPNLWGWMYLDEVDLVEVAGWVIFGVRGWKKKPPPRMIKAMSEARERDWNTANGRPIGAKAPKQVRDDIREQVEHELLRATPPEVGELPVCVWTDPDGAAPVLVLPHASGKQLETMRARVLTLIRQIDPQIVLIPWLLYDYVSATRPGCNLPAEIGERFLAFLTEQAQAERWAVVQVPDQPPVVFSMHLNGDIEVATKESGEIHAVGQKAVDDAILLVGSDGERLRVQEVSIQLHVTRPLFATDEPVTVDFDVTLDATGRLKSAKVGRVLVSSELADDCLLRAEDHREVLTYVRFLMHAFNAGPLQEIVTKGPQTQLWPGEVEPVVTWHDSEPDEATIRAIPKILEPPKEKTKRKSSKREDTRGGEVVVRGEDAKKAAAALAADLADKGWSMTVRTSTGEVKVGAEALEHVAGSAAATLAEELAAMPEIEDPTRTEVSHGRSDAELRPVEVPEVPEIGTCPSRNPETGRKCELDDGHTSTHGYKDGKRRRWWAR